MVAFPVCTCIFAISVQVRFALARNTRMRNNAYIFLLILLLMASCSKTQQQNLALSVLLKSSPFVEISPPKQDAPILIIIASQDEIVPPISEFVFSDDVLEKLKGMNFDNSFAVLILVGQIPEDSMINKVIREADQVVISVKNYTVGPGNYKLKGYSLPYQLISVEKTNKWDQRVEFIIEDENGNVLGKISHYIP